LLGVQLLGCLVVVVWAMGTTWICFFVIDMLLGIRMGPEEEAAGADWVEHRVKSQSFADKMEKAIERMQKTGRDRDQDGQLITQVLVDLMQSKEAQGPVSGVISNFGGQGGDTHVVQSVATVQGNHRRSISQPSVIGHASPVSQSSASHPFLIRAPF
jgi:hypothetical protein